MRLASAVCGFDTFCETALHRVIARDLVNSFLLSTQRRPETVERENHHQKLKFNITSHVKQKKKLSRRDAFERAMWTSCNDCEGASRFARGAVENFQGSCALAIKIISRENVFSKCDSKPDKPSPALFLFLRQAIYTIFFSVSFHRNVWPTCQCVGFLASLFSLVYTSLTAMNSTTSVGRSQGPKGRKNLYITFGAQQCQCALTHTQLWPENEIRSISSSSSCSPFSSCVLPAFRGLEFKTRLLVDFYTIFLSLLSFFLFPQLECFSFEIYRSLHYCFVPFCFMPSISRTRSPRARQFRISFGRRFSGTR